MKKTLIFVIQIGSQHKTKKFHLLEKIQLINSEIDPRIASPIAESYVIKECGGGGDSGDLLIGYKKHDYPISPAQIGEFGYTGDVVSVPSKKKRQNKQEWQR